MGARTALLVAAVVVAGSLGPGCRQALPPDAPQAALYRDLQRLVTVRAATGWQIDRFEIEALTPEALMSVCQVEPAVRRALLEWLDQRIMALGGPVEVAYRARGRDIDAVEDLLEATRVRDALRAAADSAERDCPFWLESRADFAGRQVSDDRWQLAMGGGGKAVGLRQAGVNDLQFGGAGRLLLGRTVGSHWAGYAGMEVGGSAGFPRGDGGDRERLVLTMDLVAPVIVRYRLVNTFVEFEAGYLAHLTEDDWGDPAHGFRVGMAVGGQATRVRWFFPGAAFGISYDLAFDDEAPLHALKLGVRVSLDLEL